MPVLESTDHITPKSVLRHRPISEEGTPPGKHPIVTTATTPVVQRASRQRPRPSDGQDEIDEWQRAGDDSNTSSAQVQPPTRRASATATSKTLPKTPLPKVMATRSIFKRNAHPLLYLGLGMFGMLVLWMVLVGVVSWYNTTMDDIRYGRPRTFQTDQFVGHNETAGTPSHFIAINLRGRIEVIEFPGGDAVHARIFMGPQLFTAGSDLVVVTLDFRDVNGDHKPDMIINIQGSQVVFINDQGTFRPLRPEERHQVEQFLQQQK